MMTAEQKKQADQMVEESCKNRIKLVLESLIKSLVDKPDEVEITVTQGDQTHVFEIRVAKGEVGKIIGKQGKMSEALRTVLKSLSAKNKLRAVLEICD